MTTCTHLAGLEGELEARGIPLGDAQPSPYGDSMRWYFVSCTFDEAALRLRLRIPDTVEFEEYDGRVAGSDATWCCRECGCAVMGMLRRYAPAGTAHVR